MKCVEIGEVVEASAATVRSQLSRALVKLRKKMNIVENSFHMGGEE